ncbi:MAG: hypothetical protein LBR56_07360 [Sporomusaceae bacterium]|nr:hypothetical protein [Sporomusaceae bacterium]
MLKKDAQKVATAYMSAKEDLQGAWFKNRRNRIIMLIAAAVIAAIFVLPSERFIALLQMHP